MKTHLFLGVTLGLALVAGSAVAQGAKSPSTPAAKSADQDQQEILLDTIRANRKAFVAVNLQLGDEEAKKFWPLYDKYQGEQKGIQDRVVALIDDYSKSFPDLSDDKAMKLMQDYLAAEADRVQLRRNYLPEFQKILPGRTVARFYQLENKLDAVVRYDLASSIPVIDQKAASPAPPSPK